MALDWRVLGSEGRTAVRAELQAIWRRQPASGVAPSNGARAAEAGPRPEAASPGEGERSAVSGDGELSPLQDGRVLV